MASERFEMRIDSDLLERLDQWRQRQNDAPSRAEAVRLLIEAGLAHTIKEDGPVLSDGEKLIAVMLGDLIKGMKIKSDTDVDLVQKAIYGGHYWALGWEMQGIFHGHADRRSRVSFVVDVLDMWSFIEEAFEKVSAEEKERLAKEVGSWGKDVQFVGFDGNNESEHLSIARFLVNDLQRFGRFRTGHRDLNSHHETLETYRAMYRVFEPLRSKLVGKRLSVDQLIAILKAG